MHSEYGIDCDDEPLLRGRNWRWLHARVLGLLSVPPLYVQHRDRLVMVQQTRLALALQPPEFE